MVNGGVAKVITHTKFRKTFDKENVAMFNNGGQWFFYIMAILLKP